MAAGAPTTSPASSSTGRDPQSAIARHLIVVVTGTPDVRSTSTAGARGSKRERNASLTFGTPTLLPWSGSSQRPVARVARHRHRHRHRQGQGQGTSELLARRLGSKSTSFTRDRRMVIVEVTSELLSCRVGSDDTSFESADLRNLSSIDPVRIWRSRKFDECRVVKLRSCD